MYVQGCTVLLVLLQAAIGSFALDIAVDRNLGEDVESLSRKVRMFVHMVALELGSTIVTAHIYFVT